MHDFFFFYMVQNMLIEECAKIHEEKLNFGIDFEKNVEFEH